MSRLLDARTIERDAYRSRWDDGLVDLFGGLSLLWIGAAWYWFDALAGVAAVLPAALAGPFVTWRTGFVTARAGYVRFSAARRRWERRHLLALVAVGVVLAVAMVGLVVFSGPGESDDLGRWAAPGLIAWLAAVPILVVAVASLLPRLFAYVGVLVVGGLVVAAADGNPGMPLLAAGAVAAMWGTSLLIRFTRRHPTPANEGILDDPTSPRP